MADNLIILDSIYEGSTYSGAEIEVYSIEQDVEVPVVLTGSDIVMNLTKNGDVHRNYNTTDGTLEIDTNKIVIPQHDIDIESGVYTFDFDILLSNNVKITGFGKGTWTILQPITVR